MIHELKHYRNMWAHHVEMDYRELYRFLDTTQLMLSELGMNHTCIQYVRVHNTRIRVMGTLCRMEGNSYIQ